MTALLPPPQTAAEGLPSWRVLRRRLGMLQITAQDLEGLATFGALQRLAKARYRLLSKRYHPDAMRTPRHPHPEQGYRFQRITATYRWLCAWPPTAALPERAALPPLRYHSPPIGSVPLPWAMQPRAWALPDGFHPLPHWTD